jgi:hypothetical protein
MGFDIVSGDVVAICNQCGDTTRFGDIESDDPTYISDVMMWESGWIVAGDTCCCPSCRPSLEFELVEGSLLDSDTKYIVHQCNCVTNRAAHLSAAVFQRFPWADIYSPRAGLDVPRPDEQTGMIAIRGDGDQERLVVAILGQYYPGSPRFPNSNRDGYRARQGYFLSGLRCLLDIDGLDSVSFPWGIGCGAAGGDWGGWYLPMIRGFARAARSDGVTTRIYRIQK